MGARRVGRELAVQALYRMAITGEGEAGPVFWEHFAREGGEAREFAARLVAGVRAEAARIEGLIEDAADNWRVERLAVVDRSVLSVAIFELLVDVQTPVSVVIDEAVEIARRYGEDGSPAFVNGVLDRIARRVRPAAEGEPGARG